MLIGEQMVPYGKQFIASYSSKDEAAQVLEPSTSAPSTSNVNNDAVLDPKTTSQPRLDA